MKSEKSRLVNALVVDDNEVNTMILANMLEVFDIHADQANHGMEAVLMSKKTFYDIILIDHVMPEMDGAQTTAAIRKISSDLKKSVIIALTSNITEQVKNLYREAGANEIFEKPIGLVELAALLKKWCPRAQINNVAVEKEVSSTDQENEMVKAIINQIDEINYSTGLKYAIGNPIQYINILEVSLKDLQQCINIIINSFEKNSMDQLRIGVHNLKSIFSNIGAPELSKEAGYFENVINLGDKNEIKTKYNSFTAQLEDFRRKLQYALENYYVTVQLGKKNKEQVYVPMSKEEYEQCLLNTIYYIKRYEYDAIIKELERLIHNGQVELKTEFEWAFREIKDFNYEKALARIIKIKNETVDVTVPDKTKS
jgi:CheY-like chemotaxis protein